MVKTNTQKLLIVALCKISSAIIDIQEIEDEKMFKGNIKRDINNFIKWYNDYSKPLNKIYYQTNPKYANMIVDQFDNYDTTFTLVRHADARMCLFHSKLLSAIRDFESVTFEDFNDIHYFGKLFSEKAFMLLGKGFWNQYVKHTSTEGESVVDLCFNMTNFGKKIYTEEDEQT